MTWFARENFNKMVAELGEKISATKDGLEKMIRAYQYYVQVQQRNFESQMMMQRWNSISILKMCVAGGRNQDETQTMIAQTFKTNVRAYFACPALKALEYTPEQLQLVLKGCPVIGSVHDVTKALEADSK